MQVSVWTKFSIAIIAVAVLYTLVGFLLGPYLVERLITSALSENTSGDVAIERVRVNPFVLSVELSQLTIDAPDNTALFALSRAQARFDIASLLGQGWIIRDLILDAPRLWVPAANDVWTGFARLQDALSQMASGDSPVAVVEIAYLEVRRGELQLADARTVPDIPAPPFDLTALELTMKNLNAGPRQPAEFTLAAVVNRSGRLRATGGLKLSPAALDASVYLSGLDLAEFSSMTQLCTDLEILSALLTGEVRVHFKEGRTTIRGEVSLDQVEMVDRSSRAPVFTATEVLATALAIQSSPLKASVEVLHLEKPHLRIALDADGTLHGAQWLRPLIGGPARLNPSTQRIEIQDGRLDFTDLSLTPSLRVEADRIEGSIGQRDSGTEASTTVSLEGRVMEESTARISAHWLAADPDRYSAVDLTVENFDAAVLSPYLAGREITSGQLDLQLEYRVGNGQFELANAISVVDFQLGEGRESPGAIALPLDLAVALLQDGDARMNFAIPVPPGRVDVEFDLWSVAGRAFRNFVHAIADAPFTVLGQVAGGSGQDLGRVAFESGSAALTAPASTQLKILASALEQRPGLGLKVSGRYDPVADLEALARKQVRLHVALAASAGPPGRATSTPLDFGDSKVISVLDEFAGKRLRAGKLAAIHARFPERGPACYEAVFEALVENEPISRTALKSLARYRAQTIVNQLVGAGVDSGRLQSGTEIETANAHDQAVLVELEIAPL